MAIVTCWKCKGIGQKYVPKNQTIGGEERTIICPVCEGQGRVKEPKLTVADMIKKGKDDKK